MTYDKFLDLLEEEIDSNLAPGEHIRRVQVLKNNNVHLDGFSCMMPGRREQPTVYVNNYYRSSPDPDYIREIAQMVLNLQCGSRTLPGEEIKKLLEFDKARDLIYSKLISATRNTELLEEVPCRKWLDQAIGYYLKISDSIIKNATALVRTEHLRSWGLTPEELHEIAVRNMRREPAFFQPLEQLLGEYGLADAKSHLYVLSNSRKEYGAACILDPGVQSMCGERLGGDYYVLPSSIHEVILLPASDTPENADLEEIVHTVNRRCVRAEEYLSGSVYYYSAAEKRMSLCEKGRA
ncbi:MAG: DUF5688 family protein [Lachnospiraceae bacterium]|nr:DUF5688 family protein [Lachnospiraceae bacterium]